MFNKTRIERIFKYLVEDEQHLSKHDVEIMNLKGWTDSLEEEVSGLIAEVEYLKGKVKALEEKHCCSECGKCDGACQE